MLPSVITVVSPTEAYLQKAKPLPLGQADIDTLCVRLNISPAGIVGTILDDTIEDEGGTRHPARRLTVRLGTAVGAPGAVLIKSKTRKARATNGDAKRKRGRPPKADAGSA